MRFASAHKLVTYLLVLAALAAVACTRALSPMSALAFLAACALSFTVEAGGRVARALDRAAAAVRAVAIAIFGHLSGVAVYISFNTQVLGRKIECYRNFRFEKFLIF